MSAIAEGIETRGTLGERLAAKFNPVAETQAELQPSAPAPSPDVTPAAPIPEELTPATETPQTDLPVQTEADDIFELDLDKNPLDDTPAAPTAPEAPASRKQWEAGFQDFIKMNPRGQGIWANHVAMQQLSAPPEEGGIGFKPDPSDIQQWHRTHSIMDEMMLDFAGGDTNAATKFVNYWFGKDANGVPMEGASQIAEALPTVLAQENPEAYQRIGAHFGENLIDQLSALAAAPGRSAEDAARLADAALVLGAVTGLRKPSGAQPSDPANPELEAAHARIRELEGTRQQAPIKSVENAVFGGLERALEADANQILEPLKKSYEASPEKMIVFNALKAQIVSEMRTTAKRNPAIWREVTTSIQRMQRAGGVSPEQLNGVVRLWRKGYADQAPQIRSKFLTAAGVTLTGKADEARGILQQAQNKTAPNQGSAPGQSMGPLQRNPGESGEEFRTRRIRAALNPR